jgi:mRNA interferase MazF
LALAEVPGNVWLKKGEANLPRPSVVNLTQVRTIDRDRLGELIGTLGTTRVRQVLQGLILVSGWDELAESAIEAPQSKSVATKPT